MARIAVAATAPFGADVLERLAAQHEIAALLTRPDAPQGRGRKIAPPPAKVVAERLGIPVLQPERPDRRARARRTDRRRLRLRAARSRRRCSRSGSGSTSIPSLLPRWRGAAPVERAILAGDAETGVTIHETVKELDAGPIAAQEPFPIGPDDDAGAVFERARPSPRELLDDVLAEPRRRSRRRRPRRRPTPTRSRLRTACSTSTRPADELVRQRPRALAAHRRARRAARPAGHGLAARVGRRRVRAARGAARRRQADGRYDAWLRGLR